MRTRYMMAGLLLALLAGLGLYAAPGSATAEPARLWVERVVMQDSATYTAHWAAPELGPRHREIVRYEVEWLMTHPELGRFPAHAGAVTGLSHSWTVPIPPEPVGPVVVRVRAIDTEDAASEWSESHEWYIEPLPYEPPPPPGQPYIEGPAGERIVSLVIVPDIVTMTVGDSIQACAVARWSDGVWSTSPQIPLCEARRDSVRAAFEVQTS